MTYKFLDYGEGRRLEQFGEFTLDRAFVEGEYFDKKRPDLWDSADAYFVREGRQNLDWKKIREDLPESWTMNLDYDLKCELRLASHNQVGIFPEQLENWEFVNKKCTQEKRPLKILNGFAYTGIATLYAVQAGEHVSVCHLDGSRPAISWAKKNAELSNLPTNQIRWMEDDVLTFLRREVKRGSKYDGFILDPPAFGRGKKGDWKISRDLDTLLNLVGELLTDDPVFVILSCHAEGISKYNLAEKLEQIPQLSGKNIETLDLKIPVENNKPVKMGVCARWGK
ncbi:MAG: class I SAM-dependent methyltransferase [Candidatus Peregrinibacteria bacterium]|nr:class I SAM-dependent methyltransferase [Candidatus Peregrinibacteria bacterium]